MADIWPTRQFGDELSHGCGYTLLFPRFISHDFQPVFIIYDGYCRVPDKHEKTFLETIKNEKRHVQGALPPRSQDHLSLSLSLSSLKRGNEV